jgi:hypothetical protein
LPSEPIHFIYTGVIELSSDQRVKLYPNPFTDQLTVDYSINSVSDVTISIYNTYGQKIGVIESKRSQVAGNHRVQVNTGDFDQGLYFLRIDTKDYSQLKRIIHSQH